MTGSHSKPNPWLMIPAADYEGHMASPGVEQLQFLNRVFKELLQTHRPATLAVPGCSTGNGFEHIDPQVTRRVVAIDIHPEYLELLNTRFADRISGLEIRCEEIANCGLVPAIFDQVYCALVLEYLDPGAAVRRMANWLRPQGILAVVLQLPSETSDKVSATPFASLRRLDPIMTLVDPGTVRDAAVEAGLTETRTWTETLESGKAFFIGCFKRQGAC